jgi:hypothetical protein
MSLCPVLEVKMQKLSFVSSVLAIALMGAAANAEQPNFSDKDRVEAMQQGAQIQQAIQQRAQQLTAGAPHNPKAPPNMAYLLGQKHAIQGKQCAAAEWAAIQQRAQQITAGMPHDPKAPPDMAYWLGQKYAIQAMSCR